MRYHPDHGSESSRACGSPPRALRLLRSVLPWAVAFALCLRCLPASADDLSEFEHARALYDSMRYEEAVGAFMDLVGADPPRLRDALLVIESRKYLAASLVFQDRTEEARAQFQALLRAEPDYAIDPLAFPDEVVKLFDQVKRDMAEEMRARQEAEARARAAAQAQRLAVERERKARLRVLYELARQERVEVRRSRWLAAVPFGVGQIQNGHRGLGRFFAVTQSLLLAGSVATYAAYASLRHGSPLPRDVDSARADERALRIANYSAFGGFLALVAGGIIDAEVRFEPRRIELRERELPEDVERWVETELSADGLRLRF